MSESATSTFRVRHLPAHPNLEQLSEQAQDLLREYRAGNSDAVAEVDQFGVHPDSATFALDDAQEVLARASGHKSWAALKAFVDGVNVSEFVEAVKAGDMSQVRSMLHRRPDLIGRDISESNEHRGLHFAVLQRNEAMVRLLMEAGADARQGIYPHRDATSALALARDREYFEIVAVIEEEEQRRREEMSCPNATVAPVQDQINAAIAGDDNQTAMALLDADRTLIQACDGEGASPLHVAARAGNAEMVAWLLNRRAAVNKRDVRGFTALDSAAWAARLGNENAAGFPAIARELMERGAELTISGAVALGEENRVREMLSKDPQLVRSLWRNGGLLTLAVHHGRIEMIRLLLDLGADVDERTMLGQLEEPTLSWGMPLWCAALGNRYEICEVLLDRGADPNANVYASGWPLRNAWNHKDGKVKGLLLARGAKPQPYMAAESHDVAEARRLLAENPNEAMASELAWSAADHGCAEIVQMAISNLTWPKGDPRWHWVLIQPIRGATSDRESREGHFSSMQVLLRHGVDPNVSRYGQTVLHFAAGYRGDVSDQDRARFAGMLINFGAKVSCRDDLLKSTPLGWACRWGRLELAKALVAGGAPILEEDAEPWATPSAWALKYGHSEVIRLLQPE